MSDSGTGARLSKPRPGTTVLREGWFYGDTYLQGEIGDAYREPEDRSEKCGLFIRRFQIRRGPSGKLRTAIDTDYREFPNADGMLAWIERNNAEELPPESEGNPRFVPAGFEVSDA